MRLGLAKLLSAYQLAFLTPGIWPLYASSRKQIRQMPYFLKYACGRPQILQRLYSLVENFAGRCCLIPLASALHDIGKIGIADKILNKPGKLTPEEFEVIKTHSLLGAEMLQNLDNFGEQPLLQTAYEIARWHHERWDGRGYPDGLKGDEIPISAQLVSLPIVMFPNTASFGMMA